MTTTTIAATQTDLDTVYISPYEMRIRRPRGIPKLPDELKAPPKPPVRKTSPKPPKNHGREDLEDLKDKSH